MYYTILGALIGGVGTFIVCKCRNVSFIDSKLIPSEGGIATFLGTFAGGVIGLAYGAHAIGAGSHPIFSG